MDLLLEIKKFYELLSKHTGKEMASLDDIEKCLFYFRRKKAIHAAKLRDFFQSWYASTLRCRR